jgi:glyoxylase-like metal-dependent hydrolase (beta-lactamase superfamily II)
MTPLLKESRLRENVWQWTFGGERIETSYGSNCTAVIGRESVLVVDPFIAPALARVVEVEIAKATPLPVSHVVLTHHHTDHALGAGWFARQGAVVAAHAACRAAMEAEHQGLVAARRQVPALAELFRDAEPYAPSLVVGDDGVEIDLGGSQARVFHPGPGHTRGDLVVSFAKESVTLCGDLVSVGYHVNYEDAVVENLENGLRVLADLATETYVPGHGAPGGAEILDEQRRYHAAIAAAASVDEVQRRFPGYGLSEVLSQSLTVWQKSRK